VSAKRTVWLAAYKKSNCYGSNIATIQFMYRSPTWTQPKWQSTTPAPNTARYTGQWSRVYSNSIVYRPNCLNPIAGGLIQIWTAPFCCCSQGRLLMTWRCHVSSPAQLSHLMLTHLSSQYETAAATHSSISLEYPSVVTRDSTRDVPSRPGSLCRRPCVNQLHSDQLSAH